MPVKQKLKVVFWRFYSDAVYNKLHNLVQQNTDSAATHNSVVFFKILRCSTEFPAVKILGPVDNVVCVSDFDLLTWIVVTVW